MTRPSGLLLFPILLPLIALLSFASLGAAAENPHEDPDTGVLVTNTDPPSRGECQQCHPVHAGDAIGDGHPIVLFTENTNQIPFWTQGAAPCHAALPVNYPLTEADRLPEIDPDAGYPEANDGGVRRVGVQYRGRWPGEQVFTDPQVLTGGHFVSPHAWDPDMPRADLAGEGLCLNCHNPHGAEGEHDLLNLTYGGISGHGSVSPPEKYRLCFSCHGNDGPIAMEPENRLIEDFFDPGLNGETAGHQIRKNPQIALSWPSHIQVGDMLPCYDCHNPHGSRGNNGAQPNAFLISDQRPEWSGLTDTIGSFTQSRQFCLGCHIPSDGIAGTQTIEGIVMNTLSSRGPHRSSSNSSCHVCHGSDYSSPVGNNVHNPSNSPSGFAIEEDPFFR